MDNRWIDINEQQPIEGRVVIINEIEPYHNLTFVAIGFYMGVFWQYEQQGEKQYTPEIIQGKITHWQPLPEPIKPTIINM
jgi:Protein of unknown function (DUF551)